MKPNELYSQTKSHRFASLDSLRGLAALMIVFHHLQPGSPGFLAVDLFFVLSGFILSYRYFESERPKISFADFTVARLARLYPLHLFTLFMTILVYFWTQTMPTYRDGLTSSFVQHLLLIHNIGLNSHPSWNEPSWSISVEFWVNLIVFAWLSRLKSFAILMLCLICYIIMIGHFGYISLIVDRWQGIISGGLLRCFGGFFLGMLMYRLFFFMRTKPLILHPVGKNLAFTVLESFILFTSGWVLFLTPTHMRSELNAPLVFAGLILIFAFEKGSISFLFKLLKLELLGVISYSVYLNHFWMLKLFQTLEWPAIGISYQTALFFVLPVLWTSVFTFLFIEQPFQKGFMSIWEKYKSLGR